MADDYDDVAKASWLAYDRNTPVGELQAQIEGLFEMTADPSSRAKIGIFLSVMKERRMPYSSAATTTGGSADVDVPPAVASGREGPRGDEPEWRERVYS